MAENTARHDKLMKDYPNAANMHSTAFALSKYTEKGLDICKTYKPDYHDWIKESVDNLWTIRTLKLWYFLTRD